MNAYSDGAFSRRRFLQAGAQVSALLALPWPVTQWVNPAPATGNRKLPADYAERVYAGVLGKIIGLFLGLPNETLGYQTIIDRMGGPVTYYPHGKIKGFRDQINLISTSDDLTGFFTFIRAMEDNGYPRNITPAQIGDTWLNYLVEERTSLWWGGMGESSEHTAYVRLKNGIPAPQSGSIAQNGKIIAEQIGGRIFADSWALIAPGDPELAAEFTKRASSVSHDGEGIYGGQMVVAMAAAAFYESNINKLIEIGLKVIPTDSATYKVTREVQELHAREKDWEAARAWVVTNHPYRKYGAGCPMVPNHALVIMALLYGNDDFNRSMMIVNSSGWDVDCNSCAVGCLLGIKNGLPVFNGPLDWRGPVADRLYVVSADAGRMITDAVKETFYLVNTGRALAGEKPIYPKSGARFHFDLPGALQGFQVEKSTGSSTLKIENVKGKSKLGTYALAFQYQIHANEPVRAATATFMPPETIEGTSTDGGRETYRTVYNLTGSPTLYAGQEVKAGFAGHLATKSGASVRLFIRYYGADDTLERLYSPALILSNKATTLNWTIPDLNGLPIFEIGLEITASTTAAGTLFLDYLTWEGAPQTKLGAVKGKGTMWRRAWLNAADKFSVYSWSPEYPYFISQSNGTGLVIQGAREWQHYTATTKVKTNMSAETGLAFRVQGMRRYYALVLVPAGKIQLVKQYDQARTVLQEIDYNWDKLSAHTLEIKARGNQLEGYINQKLVLTVTDSNKPLTGGAVALLCTQGTAQMGAVTITPSSA